MISIGGRAHSLDEIRAVAELGYPFAEICLYRPEEVEREFDELKRLKEHYGITYLAHYPNEDNPLDAGVLARRFVPRLHRLLGLSRELGITKGTLHFSMDRDWIPPEVFEAKLGLLCEMLDEAHRQGVDLCLENLSEGCDSFARVFRALPRLGMTLDIGHAELLGRRNKSFDFITVLAGQIRHVHVHDNLGGNSVRDDLHLALGEGRVDYRAILGLLMEHGYDSTLTMEVKPADMPRTHAALEGCLY